MDVIHQWVWGKGLDPFIYTYRNIIYAMYIYIYICIIKCIQLQYARTMFNILPRLHITKRDIRNGLTLQG